MAAYIVAVVRGLPKDNRIDAATLGIIGIGILAAIIVLRPDIFEHVTRLEVAGWKVDIEKRQEKQDKQLNDIQLILPILLPEAEQKHLLNLASGGQVNEKGNHDLRTQLRRLRSIKLIRMLSGKEVNQITNDLTVNIGQFVELTDLGKRWVSRIQEIEAEAAKAAGTRA
ncbi:MAG TPA: hypothetical protein VGJ51_13375 [Candidatus Angelobacter sp.]